VNYTGTVTTLGAIAEVMKKQRHGKIVYLSSVAGERVRLSNPVYGSSKAGADAFAQGLSDKLVPFGVNVLIVRPGFVASKMTAHLKPAPFATTPGAVALATKKALGTSKRIIWVPGLLRWIFAAFRHLPLFLWRKVSAKA
jgi:decaprenylphospho-beta-D-erythro-pentofuranosid-2-ulose 2-reductase